MGATPTAGETATESSTALDYADGLRELASFIEANPHTEFADHFCHRLDLGIGMVTYDRQRYAAMVAAIGATPSPQANSDGYIIAERRFGPVRMRLMGNAASVAERRVVGTRTVDVEEWVIAAEDGAA